MTVRGAACCLLLIAGAACGLAAGNRTALVVGNQRYESAIGALRNSTNDAKAVARALRALGFAVIEKTNLNRDQLLAAMDEFRRTLPGAEVGLFFYAGHGLSIEGSNYLVPIKSGFSPGGADDVTLRMLAETRIFNAEQAMADMSAAGARCTIVILDACRAEEAFGEYEAALKLDPDDAYILYNRGCAHLALGRREEAKTDFNAAAGSRFDQPGARKLATRALEEMEPETIPR